MPIGLVTMVTSLDHPEAPLESGLPSTCSEGSPGAASPKKWLAGQYGVSSGAIETRSFKLELPQGTTIEAAYWAGKKHMEETLNLKAYADYRPVGSVPHPTMSGMGIWSYSYKA